MDSGVHPAASFAALKRVFIAGQRIPTLLALHLENLPLDIF